MNESPDPRRRNKKRPSRRDFRIGSTAVCGTTRLQGYQLIQLLVRNVLVSRETLYGIPEWTASYAPDLFDLYHTDIKLLQDDQLGRCLARLFTDITPELLLAVVKSAINNIGVSLEEIHNDSNTVRFHGEYATARDPKQKKARYPGKGGFIGRCHPARPECHPDRCCVQGAFGRIGGRRLVARFTTSWASAIFLLVEREAMRLLDGLLPGEIRRFHHSATPQGPPSCSRRSQRFSLSGRVSF